MNALLRTFGLKDWLCQYKKFETKFVCVRHRLMNMVCVLTNNKLMQMKYYAISITKKYPNNIL